MLDRTPKIKYVALKLKIALMVLKINNLCLLFFQTFSLLSRHIHICKKYIYICIMLRSTILGVPGFEGKAKTTINSGFN